MSAPAKDTVYIHTTTGARFRYVGRCAAHNHIVLTRLDVIEDGWFYVTNDTTFDTVFVESDDLLALAETVSVLIDALRQPGEPLAVEFSAGPVGPGPLWTDEHLADVFGLRGPGGAA